MSDYPMLISNKLHSFRNFLIETKYNIYIYEKDMDYHYCRNSCYCCLRNFFV